MMKVVQSKLQQALVFIFIKVPQTEEQEVCGSKVQEQFV
jgi:hypothetical protein